MNAQNPQSEHRRDERGRFTKGCRPGPGRPRKKRLRLPPVPHELELRIWLDDVEKLIRIERELDHSSFSTETIELLRDRVKALKAEIRRFTP